MTLPEPAISVKNVGDLMSADIYFVHVGHMLGDMSATHRQYVNMSPIRALEKTLQNQTLPAKLPIMWQDRNSTPQHHGLHAMITF